MTICVESPYRKILLVDMLRSSAFVSATWMTCSIVLLHLAMPSLLQASFLEKHAIESYDVLRYGEDKRLYVIGEYHDEDRYKEAKSDALDIADRNNGTVLIFESMVFNPDHLGQLNIFGADDFASRVAALIIYARVFADIQHKGLSDRDVNPLSSSATESAHEIVSYLDSALVEFEHLTISMRELFPSKDQDFARDVDTYLGRIRRGEGSDEVKSVFLAKEGVAEKFQNPRYIEQFFELAADLLQWLSKGMPEYANIMNQLASDRQRDYLPIVVDLRDERMAENTEKIVKQGNAKVFYLIVGEGHRKGIVSKLRDRPLFTIDRPSRP